MNKPLPTSDNYLDGDVDNPFARIFCRGIPNKVCSGTCGGCKKDRSTFLEKKVQRQLELAIKDPQYGDGADHTAPLDISQIEKGIRERVNAAMKKIEQKKQEEIELRDNFDKYMDRLYTLLLSSAISTTPQQ